MTAPTQLHHQLLRSLRGLHRHVLGQPAYRRPACDQDPDSAAHRIHALLTAGRPAMIARFGSTELTCIANYLAIHAHARPWLRYIRGQAEPWWWNINIVEQMAQNAGFFPAEISAIERFCELMLQDIPEVDLLGSWLEQETLFATELQHCPKVDLELLNPYFSTQPWTRALAGRKVLVVHPFAHSIQAQYPKRDLLFKNGLLPSFELHTLKAVQSIAGEKTEYTDWFAALDAMKAAMDQVDYDICLIGCGAYGFPLAAHAKRRGKIGVHLGGSLQLLFGIRGKRWENPDYNPRFNFAALMNAHWIKPAEEERPKTAGQVEDACYW